MSAAVSPPDQDASRAQPVSPAPIVRESCPLCGTALRPGQEWCLSCGAAARTRLAAAPNWRTPVLALAATAALALGGLAAALVKLAGETGPGPAPITRTLTTAAPAAAVPPVAGVAPTSSVPAPATSTPVPRSATPTAPSAVPRTTPGGAATTPRSTTPRTPTNTTTTTTTPSGTPNTKKLEGLNLPGRIGFKR